MTIVLAIWLFIVLGLVLADPATGIIGGMILLPFALLIGLFVNVATDPCAERYSDSCIEHRIYGDD